MDGGACRAILVNGGVEGYEAVRSHRSRARYAIRERRALASAGSTQGTADTAFAAVRGHARPRALLVGLLLLIRP
ncbi:hypothetical protein ASF08_20985 [Methylobacterium sp. Leaf85]|nr:hypothetical protein ASF08_20985 [Methylobacterium sp. Leaf85]